VNLKREGNFSETKGEKERKILEDTELLLLHDLIEGEIDFGEHQALLNPAAKNRTDLIVRKIQFFQV
jgi:hypothetical protein